MSNLLARHPDAAIQLITDCILEAEDGLPVSKNSPTSLNWYGLDLYDRVKLLLLSGETTDGAALSYVELKEFSIYHQRVNEGKESERNTLMDGLLELLLWLKGFEEGLKD